MIFWQPCKVQKSQAAASGKGFVNVLGSLLGSSHDLGLQLMLTSVGCNRAENVSNLEWMK